MYLIQLESLLFNHHVHNYPFMRNFRYCINDLVNIGNKIIDFIYSICHMRLLKKMGIYPRDMTKLFKEMFELTKDNFKTNNRVVNMANDIINTRIKKLDGKRGKNLKKLQITWNNLVVIVHRMYGDRDITIPINIMINFVKNKWYRQISKINKKFEKKMTFRVKKDPIKCLGNSDIGLGRNVNGELVVMGGNPVFSNVVTGECGVQKFFGDIVLDINMNAFFCKIYMRKNDKINNIEDIKKFLANKGPNYSIRTRNKTEMNKEMIEEFNNFLIRERNYQKMVQWNQENLEKNEDKPDKIEDIGNRLYIPLENRRANLPEILEYNQEEKLKQLYREIASQIDKDIQLDNHVRKDENQKIKKMKKILKDKDMTLITTDKTKRVIAISNQQYKNAGEAFLSNTEHYRKLDKDHSMDIEKKANNLVKKIKIGFGLTQNDIEKVTMVGSKPANFFLNIKDHKSKDKNGNFPVRPIASVHNTPVDGIDYLIQLILKQALKEVPTNIISNRDICDDCFSINCIKTGQLLEVIQNRNTESEEDLENLRIKNFNEYISIVDNFNPNTDVQTKHIRNTTNPRVENSFNEDHTNLRVETLNDNTLKDYTNTRVETTEYQSSYQAYQESLKETKTRWNTAELGIISLDVVNLYPSIPLWDGINKVIEFIKTCKNIRWFGLSLNLIREMLYVICFNYEVRFKNIIYLQKKGVPMGARFAPPRLRSFTCTCLKKRLSKTKN